MAKLPKRKSKSNGDADKLAAPKIGKWPAEEWRAIPDLDGYEASSEGRIRSLDRYVRFHGRWGPTTRHHRGRILRLKPKANGWGGIYWSFYTDGAKYWQVNRAVCSAFHGNPPTSKHEAAHLDGNTNNDRPSNLQWSTAVENAAHKITHGTASRGSKNGTAKLDEAKVTAIIERYSNGEQSQDLAAEFGMSRSSITGIVGSQGSWTHVISDKREAAKARSRQNIFDGPRRKPEQLASG